MRYLALMLTVLVVGCDSPVEPLPRPPGAVEMEPLPEYAQWESELEACSGMEADFSGIEWYMVPGDSWTDTEGRLVEGTYRTSGKIFLAEVVIGQWGPVVHEMGHHLAWTTMGSEGHPDPPFGSCAPH